jgi:deoxycytidylate deaminase
MTTKYKLTAMAFDKKGRLLSVGTNSYLKTHPVQAKYAKLANVEYKIYLHAEVAALIKAKGKVHKLVISRLGKDGQFLPSKPCAICQRAIEDFGVVEVEFTE